MTIALSPHPCQHTVSNGVNLPQRRPFARRLNLFLVLPPGTFGEPKVSIAISDDRTGDIAADKPLVTSLPREKSLILQRPYPHSKSDHDHLAREVRLALQAFLDYETRGFLFAYPRQKHHFF